MHWHPSMINAWLLTALCWSSLRLKWLPFRSPTKKSTTPALLSKQPCAAALLSHVPLPLASHEKCHEVAFPASHDIWCMPRVTLCHAILTEFCWRELLRGWQTQPSARSTYNLLVHAITESLTSSATMQSACKALGMPQVEQVEEALRSSASFASISAPTTDT
jgi:hypothetical protein